MYLGEVVSIQKKHIVEKDVVGLLLGEVVSTKEKHILAKDVVGLLVGYNEDLGWEFRFLVPISGTPIGSRIPDPFPIPKIPVGKILIKFRC